LKNVQSRVD